MLERQRNEKTETGSSGRCLGTGALWFREAHWGASTCFGEKRTGRPNRRMEERDVRRESDTE